MDLTKLINEKRTIKPNSLKSYLIILRKLNDGKPIENLEFLKNTNEIMAIINEKALTTQRNYIGAILVGLGAFDKAEFDIALQFYRDHLDTLNEKYNEFIKTHKKSDNQSENWITLKELKKSMNFIKKELDEKGILKKIDLTNKEFMALQRYIIQGLYILQPPVRLDFSMEIIKNEDDVKTGTNYLLVKSRNLKFFIFTEFKTSGSYGIKKIKVNSKLNQLLNIWLKFNKSKFLLLNTRGGKLSSNGLGKMITKAFESTKKKITINLIRHVFISENVDLEALEKQKKLAELMHHSGATQKSYIKID